LQLRRQQLGRGGELALTVPPSIKDSECAAPGPLDLMGRWPAVKRRLAGQGKMIAAENAFEKLLSANLSYLAICERQHFAMHQTFLRKCGVRFDL
jgi:hypothetical protein